MKKKTARTCALCKTPLERVQPGWLDCPECTVQYLDYEEEVKIYGKKNEQSKPRLEKRLEARTR